MSRAIKFKGQRVDNKEWVYGYAVFDSNHSHLASIIDYADHTSETYTWHDVIPETVGQYTNLKDKNGNDIYEGDYDENYDVVAWCEKRNGWSMWVYDLPTNEFIECHCYNCAGDFEISEVVDINIVGNIYQHN